MSALVYSLNATLPLFLIIMLGYGLQRCHWFTKDFATACDKLVFHVTLPVTLFLNMASVDIRSDFHFPFVVFCFVSSLLSILGIWLLTKMFLKDKTLTGEFIQAGYRSSAAILGSALIQNLYGSSSYAPMMILGSVPLYNLSAVLILSLGGKDTQSHNLTKHVLGTLLSLLCNPIIIGIALGSVTSYFRLGFPPIIANMMNKLAAVTIPLSLLSIGIGFQGFNAIRRLRPTVAITFIKLILLPALFLPLAVWCGFADQELVAALVMLGGPTTFGCYIMAKNMGHEGVLTSSAVAVTTPLSAVTLTLWMFLLRTLHLVV